MVFDKCLSPISKQQLLSWAANSVGALLLVRFACRNRFRRKVQWEITMRAVDGKCRTVFYKIVYNIQLVGIVCWYNGQSRGLNNLIPYSFLDIDKKNIKRNKTVDKDCVNFWMKQYISVKIGTKTVGDFVFKGTTSQGPRMPSES